MELELNEVIENLEYLVSDSCTDTQFDYIEEIEIATKSLKKQIPMKSTEVSEDYGYFECPACGDLIYADGSRFEEHKYCLSCGQKLDWRNEK